MWSWPLTWDAGLRLLVPTHSLYILRHHPTLTTLPPAPQFDLVGLPPAPRGVPQIEVIFDIDANGIVHVSAKDKGTGKEQSIAIQSSGGLSDSEIEKMVRSAEEFAVADKKKKEFIEAKNDGDSLVYSTDKSLAEHKAKLSAEDITEIEKSLADTRAALSSDDVEVLKAATAKLQTAAMRIGSAMYKNSGACGWWGWVGVGLGWGWPGVGGVGAARCLHALSPFDSTSAPDTFASITTPSHPPTLLSAGLELITSEETKKPEGETVDAEFKEKDTKK